MKLASIEVRDERIADICRKYGLSELSVFGSVLREDFAPESDVDFLVVFENNDTGPCMAKLNRLEFELSELLGHKADAIPKDGLKWVIQDRVLSSAEVIYVATKR